MTILQKIENEIFQLDSNELIYLIEKVTFVLKNQMNQKKSNRSEIISFSEKFKEQKVFSEIPNPIEWQKKLNGKNFSNSRIL